MSPTIPQDEADAGVDRTYGRLSQLEESAPSEATRRAILAHAREVAGRARTPARRPPAWSGWLSACGRPAALGTLAAGIIGAVLLIPHTRPQPSGTPVDETVSTNTRPDAGEAGPLREEPPPATTTNMPAHPAPPSAPAPSAAAAPPRHARAAPPPRMDEVEELRAGAAGPSAKSGIPTPIAADAAAPAPPIEEVVVARAAPSSASALASAARAAPSLQGGFVARQDPGAALRRAAAGGDVAQVADLVKDHSLIEARDSQGRTPLMLAVLAHQAATARALLEAGADVNAADAGGVTPLAAARAANDPQIAALLEGYAGR